MPYQSPTYTQVPNELLDVHLADIKKTELKVTLALIRQTLGFHRRRRRMSLSALEKATGLARTSVVRGLNAAIDRGTVAEISEAGVALWEIQIVVAPRYQNGSTMTPPSIKETIKDKPSPSKEGDTSKRFLLAKAIAQVCHMNLDMNKGRIFREAKTLLRAGATHTEVLQRYSPGGWWYLHDWRGKKGQLPKPTDICPTWGQWGATAAERDVGGIWEDELKQIYGASDERTNDDTEF